MLESGSGDEKRTAFLPSADATGLSGMRQKSRILFAASFVHAMHITTVYLGPSTLLSPMRLSLQLSVTEIALPLNLFRLANAALLAPAGIVLDRVGPERTVWPAMVLVAFFGLLAPMARSLSDLLLLQLFYAVSKLFGGLTAMLMLVNRAFGADSAGWAASVVLGGFSLAGTIIPALIGFLSTRFGWRVALAVLNISFAVVALPLTHFFLRCPITTAHQKKGKNIPVVARPDAEEPVFSKQYTATLLMMGFLSVSLHVVIDHFIVFLRDDVGLSFQRCTLYLSLLNFVALIAKLLSGWLSDRYNRSLLFAMSSAVGGLSCFCLVSISPSLSLNLASSESSILAFVILYGFGYSSIFALITTALPEFGKERMGLRSNLNLMFFFGFGSFGSFAAGHLRTSSGSYAQSFLLNSTAWIFIFGCVALYAFGGMKSRSTEKNSQLGL